MITVTVARNSEVLVQFAGYDRDGDELEVYITELPEVGSVHQLSQVFSDYGWVYVHGTLSFVMAHGSCPFSLQTQPEERCPGEERLSPSACYWLWTQSGVHTSCEHQLPVGQVGCDEVCCVGWTE